MMTRFYKSPINRPISAVIAQKSALNYSGEITIGTRCDLANANSAFRAGLNAPPYP